MAPRMGPGSYLDPGTLFFTKKVIWSMPVQSKSLRKKNVLAREREARFILEKSESMWENVHGTLYNLG